MLGMSRIVALGTTRINNEFQKVIDMSKLDGTVSKLDGTMFKFDGTVSKFDGTFRHAGFRLWPMGKTESFKSSHTKSQLSQEEKNEEREKSPPLKEKEARKEEPLYAGARPRV